MIGWFSFLFFVFVFVFSFFFFFALSLITVPQEQQWLTCKVLCLNGKCKTVLQKYKCSVSRVCCSGPPGTSKLMAQLGSNPFKPHLRATADTATPSEASESGSILARKPLHFPSLSPNTRDRQGRFPADRWRPTGVFTFPSILSTWIMVSKCMNS